MTHLVLVLSHPPLPEVTVADRISRQQFLSTAAAISLLAGCENGPAACFLGVMRQWNEEIEKAIKYSADYDFSY
jgi:hypothetical protein